MTTDKIKPDPDNPQQQFAESFDDFCVGLVDIVHIRATITELLESEPHSAETILGMLDTAFREGLIKGSTYDSLTSEVDRVTSEDEPTEWSEETREQFADASVTTTEDTDYPAATPGAAPDASPGEAVSEIAPGAVFKNRFELIAHIGSGSMANVYEAIDWRKQEAGSSDPRLAIKVISSAFSAHPAALQTLQREALNSQRLIHPNIIRVFDCDSDNDHFFMTMELLDGQPLVAMLDERRLQPLPFNQALSIIRGMCDGLQYAHEHSIIHADIKPGNIFMLATGQAKILDFGISRIASDDGEENDLPLTGAHTPAYASCEVLEGAEPTLQDDIFAMACVSYRMLSGHRAFGGLTALDAEREQINPQRIETLNPQQWHALEKSLAFRRADRSTQIVDFAAAFFNRTPTTKSADQPPIEPDIVPRDSESRGLPLRFGIPAIAVMLIAMTLIVFWPEPELEPEFKPKPIPRSLASADSPAPDISLEPQDLTDSTATDADQPATEADKPPAVEPLVPVAAAEPPPEPEELPPAVIIEAPSIPSPEPGQTRIEELETLADNAMNDGRLLEPADDSAHLFVMELTTLAPEAPDVQQRRTRLAELMLLEAMVAITDEDFDAATLWISETRALGVPEETTQRFEIELQKARDAKSARQTDTLGAIFASAIPAAILAGPDLGPGDEQDTEATPETEAIDPDAGTGQVTGLGSLSLAMIMPGALPDVPTEEVDRGQTGEGADTANNYVPLSTLKFERFVEPKISRRLANRRVSGWVEVNFRVTTDGRTDEITVIASQPDDRFEKTAIKAVSKWRFKPIYVDGVATEKYSGIRLHFKP